jgi:hypothetical protein
LAKNRDVPSAQPPTLFTYEVPGQLKSLEGRRAADRETRQPRADYARGSPQDRFGNRGH